MKFRTKWSKAIYIVRPSRRAVNQLGIISIQPGLRAVFDEETHEFDSKRAQEEADWTDEERLAVERHLLKHKDYGNGLILMPGQEIPQELEGVAVKARERVAAKCAHIWFEDGDVKQCDKESLPGIDKCETHREKKGEIVRGMLTA